MITLQQAQVGRTDKVDQKVIENFRRNSLLLDKMVFDDAVVASGNGSTLEYGYMREETPSVADFREINKEYTPQETTRKKYTVNVKVFGGAYQVDRVIEETSGRASEVATQSEAKIKATCTLFAKTVIDGDSDVDERAFDGLDKALRGTSTELNVESYLDLSDSDAMDKNYKKLLDLMDEFLASLSGRPACIMANTSMITKLKAAARRAGYLTHAEDSFGRQVAGYDDIPFMDMGYYPKKLESGMYTEAPVVPVSTRKFGTADNEKTVTGLTDIYAPVIDMKAFHGVTVKGDKFIYTYLPDFRQPGAVKTGEVEMLAAVALKNSRGAAVLRNIKIK